jgi:ABC-2 type transport system permease protein
MLNIFMRMWLVSWAERWQYRANLLMYLLYGLVSPIVFLSVWRAVAQSQGEVGGLTANDFTTYYLTLLLVENLTSEITIWILAHKIQDGTLSGELLRPIHPVLVNNLITNLGHKVLNFIVLIPIWLLLVLVFQPDFSAVRLENVLIALPIIMISFLINFLLGAIITCVAFWTTRVYSLSEFLFGFVMLLGGTFVPLDLLPGLAQNIARLLPFQLFVYFPIQLILGRLSPDALGFNILMQFVWLVVTFAGFRFIWREGLKRFSAVGA